MCRHTKVALFSAVLLNALPALLGAAQDGQATVVAQEEVHINLDRIRQRLEALPVEGVDSFLRLEYRLSVYAKAPEINPLEGFDARNGEVPYGLPTCNLQRCSGKLSFCESARPYSRSPRS